MDNEKIWESITRNLTAESDEQDKRHINSWLKADESNRQVYDRLQQVWDFQPEDSFDSSDIFKKIQQRRRFIEPQKLSQKLINYSYRIAAVLFLVLAIGILLPKFGIQFFESQLSYQEISVPKGNRTFLILPDSSKVWVSNNSTLKYPTTFASNSRELYLSGEAYFEVKHNSSKPFIVNVGKNRIRVLGTKFSVRAYPEDDRLKTELLEGKVELDIRSKKDKKKFQTFELKPGYSLSYSKKNSSLKECKIRGDFHDYWIKGIYAFKDENLRSLAKKIERIYNVQIEIENDYLKAKKFTGSFSVDDNIYTFIEYIIQTSVVPIEYRYEKNKILLKLKN